MLRSYYELLKPGVMYGNVLTGAAGFFLAAAGRVDWGLFMATIIGMTLVVGSACAINNYLDRDIDQKMTRTQKRPSVTGEVQPMAILAYSLLLGVLGFVILALWTNWLVVTIGGLGWVTYVWLYGAWSKRQSVHGTIVGSISGAMPIAGGYAAVSGHVDLGMIIAFLAVFFWQFPEFYSIAIYRRKEYAAADVPVITVARSVTVATRQILIYTILYVMTTLCLTLFDYTGWVYFIIMLGTGVHWIWLGSRGLHAKNTEQWARQMFRYAMVNILVLCVMFSLGPLLP